MGHGVMEWTSPKKIKEEKSEEKKKNGVPNNFQGDIF